MFTSQTKEVIYMFEKIRVDATLEDNSKELFLGE